MNTINSGPSQNYQAIAPYAPLGKPAAGLESSENKDQTLPPVEEANASEKKRNQPNQKTDAVAGDARDSNGRGDQQSAELTEEEPQVLEPAATERQVQADAAAYPAVGGASFRFVTGADGARYAVGGDKAGSSASGDAVASFSAAAGRTLAPGSLLDQRS